MGKYHFIAIGGIGMSGLAKYLIEEGHEVSGSDIVDSKYIDNLKKMGAKITIGHSASNVPDGAIVVVSSAIREDNPEVLAAISKGLKIYHRSGMLRKIAETSQKEGNLFIGFSGTHGKTTTSGLCSYVLDKGGFEPSFVDGGIVPDLNVNSQHKRGKYFIAELDESDGTIVKYSPDILVINNIEEDHLDYYKNGMPDLVKTFESAIANSKKVIVNNDNKGVNLLNGDFITFGLNDADYTAKNIEYSKEFTSFDVLYKGDILTSIKIQLAGEHNVYNTLAVISAINEAGINVNDVKDYFYDFTGMGRRFQKICEFGGISVYDDYAHHPTEIKTTLSAAASKFGKENVIAVFQPHRYTRLKSLWNDFKQAFNDAGKLIITDVYAASENPIEGINAELFSKELSGSKYYSGSISDVARKLYPTLKSGDVVIGLGAGTITVLGKELDGLSKRGR